MLLPGDECSSDAFWCDDDGNPIAYESKDRNYIPVAEKADILAKVIPLLDKGYTLEYCHRHGGSKLKYRYYIPRWQEDVRNGGTVWEKFKAIDDETWKKFQESKQAFRNVHGHDIEYWALQAASKFPETPNFRFTASDTWLSEFKKRHKISSRRINKLVKRNHMATMPELEGRIQEFRCKAKDLVTKYGAENVINWDQSGCSYEIVANRTLSHRGEPWTTCSAWSPKNKATHSYTVQYTLTANGRVLGPLYLCLQEPSGRIGPQVERNLPETPNVLLTCSKSGKLTTSLVEYYLDNSLVQLVQSAGKSMGFVMDHWSGQVDSHIYSSRFGVHGTPTCEILTVPKNCTSEVQPCDVLFFRQFKYFLKRITEFAQVHPSNDDRTPLYQRNNVIILQSILHYQMSAAIFQPLIRYSWYKGGICNEKEPYFNVKQACFNFGRKTCELQECAENAFVQCARCRKCICFNCFIWLYHCPAKGCEDLMEAASADS